MLFVSLVKFKKKLSKDDITQNLKDIEDDAKGGVHIVDIYWTLGRYDSIVLFEAPNETIAMKMALKRADRMEVETLVAVPASEKAPYGPT